MNLTEDQARVKWCPFMKTPGAQGPFANRCISSHCMAWRWRVIDSKGTTDDRGYCGLSGRPLT
jgi:hypothetical protein